MNFHLQPVPNNERDSSDEDVFRQAEKCDNDVSAEIAIDPDTVQLNDMNIFQVSVQ